MRQKAMHSPVSLSQEGEKNLRVKTDRDPTGRVRMELVHKPAGVFQMVKLETPEGLYWNVMQVHNGGQAQLAIAPGKSVLHSRVGHFTDSSLKNHIRHFRVKKDINVKNLEDCRSCAPSTAVRSSEHSTSIKNAKAAKLPGPIYSDLIGPVKQKPRRKAVYFATLLDSFSGYSLVRFICRRDGTTEAFINMVHELEGLPNISVRSMSLKGRIIFQRFHTDSSGDCIGHATQARWRNRCTKHKVITAYSPESNVNAGRLDGTLSDMARTMLASIPAPN